MPERDRELPPLELDLSFGPAPSADDPLASLAAEIETELDADTVRRRKREGRRQEQLRSERGPALAPEELDPDALEIALRGAGLDFERPEGEVAVRTRTARVLSPTPSPLAGLLAPLARVTAPVFSFGPDPDNTLRVLRGLVGRATAGLLAGGLVVAAVAGPGGSAYVEAYAPEAALARHTGGLAAGLVAGGEAPDAAGVVDPYVAAGLTSKIRAFLDAFDAAAASGDTAPLAALFSKPGAAETWTTAATRLHAAGARRTYPFVDPRTTNPAFFSDGDGRAELAIGGPLVIVDLATDGTEVRRVEASGLLFRFQRIGEAWELIEAVILA